MTLFEAVKYGRKQHLNWLTINPNGLINFYFVQPHWIAHNQKWKWHFSDIPYFGDGTQYCFLNMIDYSKAIININKVKV